MLQLQNVTKNYPVAGGEIKVLKGLDLCFRKNEFVSILGPSGCGKTTTLNIIGGLDKYTTGDLIINGKSTKNFNDRDWDNYRNHKIGFVFQTYNLIPHQTVLGNVELALTISGVPKEERVKRCLSALEKVGLKGEEYKRPNQLSGGQCQRVAIARALVNEPDILLADEPTGALDSKTSVQIMELIKEISKDKLVIMVTHNGEIAEKYSSRIIRLVDGEVTEDTKPYSLEDEQKEVLEDEQNKIKLQANKKVKKEKRAKMSRWTAFKLSLRNLFTKKGRTILTSFAGSIGIIGIALILAVSQGTTAYINHVQETALSSYPIPIETESMDLSSLMESFMNISGGGSGAVHDKDAIYKDPIILEMVNALSKTGTSKNDLKSFKEFLDKELQNKDSKLYNAVSGVKYSYNLDLQIYTKNIDGNIIKSDTATLMNEMIAKYVKAMVSKGNISGSIDTTESMPMTSMTSFSSSSAGMWKELLPGLDDGELINRLIYDQYELIDGGSWPNEYDEIVLIVNENNELDDLTLYALGLISDEEIDAIIDAAANGTTLEETSKKWTYEEIKQMTFRTVLPANKYQNRGDGVYIDASELLMESLYERSLELKVTGIVRPKESSDVHMLTSGIGYTKLLTEYVINQAKETEVVKAQMANPDVDVLTGLPFELSSKTIEEKAQAFKDSVASQTEEEKAKTYVDILCLLAEEEKLDQTVQSFKDMFVSNPEFKAQILDSVVTEYAKQLGVEKEILQSYLSEATEEELLVYVTPVFQIMAKQQIRGGIERQLATVPPAQKVIMLNTLLQEQQVEKVAQFYDELTVFSNNTLDENLTKFGCLDLTTPFTINIYTSTFKNKDVIEEVVNDYNLSVGEEQRIHYNDYIGILMSSISAIIDAITYILISFVAISLIVSSIMIGVITLISVQERTKEIGILRSIGASKKDVSSMFNAETIIIGFTSGLLGVVVTYLLCLPINFILQTLTGIPTLRAILPIDAAIILVVISMFLTLIAGIIPSRSAAKKDPVVALRTE